MAAGDAFQELKRRAEKAGMSDQEYLDELLDTDVHLEVLRSREEWERILAPAIAAIEEGRVIPADVVRENLKRYVAEKRAK